MLKVYGIKNCTTVQKALCWLAEHHIPATLHDYRKDGVDRAFLRLAMAEFGWQNVLNKRSRTWQTLPTNVKENLSMDNVEELLLANPTLIKRPLILSPALLGFKEQEFTQAFSQVLVDSPKK